MTKNEFLSRLEAELEARRVPEPEDILGEYRRHFEYKLADGYSEEEIAARLGAPEELAAQSEPEREARASLPCRLCGTQRADLDGARVRRHVCIKLFYAICQLGGGRGLCGAGLGARVALPAHPL